MSNNFLLNFENLGYAWINLIQLIKENGSLINNEIFEIENIQINIKNISKDDLLLQGKQERKNIKEMHKVFFENGFNQFGHSYKNFIHGPKGRSDYMDIVEVLKNNLATKKAAVVLVGSDEKVPCLLTIHFLVRDNILYTKYFSRGQDIYNKYYADSLAVNEISQRICSILKIDCGLQTGFISSAHIYKKDMNKINNLLKAQASLILAHKSTT